MFCSGDARRSCTRALKAICLLDRTILVSEGLIWSNFDRSGTCRMVIGDGLIREPSSHPFLPTLSTDHEERDLREKELGAMLAGKHDSASYFIEQWGKTVRGNSQLGKVKENSQPAVVMRGLQRVGNETSLALAHLSKLGMY